MANGRWQGDPVKGLLQAKRQTQRHTDKDKYEVQGAPVKGLLQAPPVPRVAKAPVVLDSPSARLVNGLGFSPNGGWSGQPETGLLEHVPDSRRREELD